MTDKIDKLFSPERLRGKWSMDTRASKNPVAFDLPRVSEKYSAIFLELRDVIFHKFSDDIRLLLDNMMEELENSLASRFPATGVQSLSQEEIAALNIAIDQILTQMEDLTEHA